MIEFICEPQICKEIKYIRTKMGFLERYSFLQAHHESLLSSCVQHAKGSYCMIIYIMDYFNQQKIKNIKVLKGYLDVI